MNSKTVVIGGGFAGLQACRVLRNAGTEIVLFDPRACAVMLPALPDLAAGRVESSLLCRPLSEMLPKNVRHIRQAVTAIDLDARTLTAGGETVDFGTLLIAAGSVTDFHGFDGPRDRMYHLDSLESALRIRDRFADYLRAAERPHVVAAGGGYTGLELALSLFCRAAAKGKECRVTIVDPAPDILPFLPERKRDDIRRFLAAHRVTLLSGTRVSGFDGFRVTAGTQVFEDVFFCWAAGSTFAVPEIKGRVERLRDGRLNVNPDLSLPGYPDVFAAGDAAAFEHRGAFLRKAVNFSWYEGRHAGKNILRRRRGKKTAPFRPFDAGWVLPLRLTGIGQLFGRFWVQGRIALFLHYFMCGFRNYRFTNFAGFARLAADSLRRTNDGH